VPRSNVPSRSDTTTGKRSPSLLLSSNDATQAPQGDRSALGLRSAGASVDAVAPDSIDPHALKARGDSAVDVSSEAVSQSSPPARDRTEPIERVEIEGFGLARPRTPAGDDNDIEYSSKPRW